DNRVASNANVPAKPGSAGAVENAGVGDFEVHRVLCCWVGGARGEEYGEQQSRRVDESSSRRAARLRPSRRLEDWTTRRLVHSIPLPSSSTSCRARMTRTASPSTSTS